MGINCVIQSDGIQSLGNRNLILGLLSGVQLGFSARAQEKNIAQEKTSPIGPSAHKEKTSQGLKPKIHQISQMFLFGAHVFIWCAAKSYHFCAQEKNIGHFRAPPASARAGQ